MEDENLVIMMRPEPVPEPIGNCNVIDDPNHAEFNTRVTKCSSMSSCAYQTGDEQY